MWRVLLYFAGDNDLDSAGALSRSLFQIETIGPSEEVEVFFQVDGLDNKHGVTGTKRFILKKSSLTESEWQDAKELSSTLVEDLGELNTGDPDVLQDFIVWGCSGLGDRKLALILWGHGTGVIDEYVNMAPSRAKDPQSARAIEKAWHRSFFKSLWAKKLEASINKFPATKSVAVDVSSNGDALEAKELRSCLTKSLERVNSQRMLEGSTLLQGFDLIAFDACFMSSLEVIWELKEFSKVYVASVAPIPNQGFPYDTILRNMISDPQLVGLNLGSLLVKLYQEDYSSRHWFVKDPVTLSAIRTEDLDAVADALEQFFANLLKYADISAENKFVVRGQLDDLVKATTEKFFNRDYVDLPSLVRKISSFASEAPDSNIKSILRDSSVSSLQNSLVQAIVVSTSRIRTDIAPFPPPINAGGLSVLYPQSQLAIDFLDEYLSLTIFSRNQSPWKRYWGDVKG